MKNIIIKLLLVLSVISLSWINYISNTYAADTVKVIVTEKIPWAWCEMIDADWNVTSKKSDDWKTQMYQCNIKKWFWTVISMLWNIIKYFTFIASLWAVLFIIINGILYSMWGAEPSMKDDAKKRIIWTLIWLILLLLSWVILNLIAPWIYK